MNIQFILIDIERNSERGGEQSPLLKELLELVAREKTRINEKKNNDEIAARAIEFDNGGMHNCPLSFGTNSELEYHIYFNSISNYL